MSKEYDTILYDCDRHEALKIRKKLFMGNVCIIDGWRVRDKA